MFSKNSTDIVLIGEPFVCHDKFTLYDSKVGGLPLWFTNIPSEYPFHCKSCGKEMYLFLQVYDPLDDLDRVIYVFGCRSSKCQLTPDGWCCIRQQKEIEETEVVEEKKIEVKKPAPVSSSLSWDFGSSGTNSLFGGSLADNSNIMDLLNKMESKGKPSSKPKVEETKQSTNTEVSIPKGIPVTTSHPSFEEHFIDIFDEPETKKKTTKPKVDVEAGEDIGKEEGGGYEHDRSISRLVKFNTVIKRNPSQVIRIAYPEGKPLLPTSANVPNVPACSCHAKRVFEFQILPTLLSFIDDDDDLTMESLKEQKEWSSILVYTCQNNCSSQKEEVVVLPPL